MKVIIANTMESGGGAARASRQLQQGLAKEGFQASRYVKRKIAADPDVYGAECSKFLDKLTASIDSKLLLKILHRKRKKGVWSLNWLPNLVAARIQKMEPHLVNLHWIGHGFINISDLAWIARPIVWTLHDSWAFTGGCHLPADCTRYKHRCGNCPQLRSGREYDVSRWEHNRKQKAYDRIDSITVVTPSRWLGECARNSALFRNRDVKVIPNGVDHRLFRPVNKEGARLRLGLPAAKKIMLYGAMGAVSDFNKGYHCLVSALDRLSVTRNDAELAVFGSRHPIDSEKHGFSTHNIGLIDDDETLRDLYAAADVMIMPSLQENLPFTVMESLACGTPVVAFDVGGVSDLIEHEINGYLVQPYDSAGLAAGIEWVLSSDDTRSSMLSENARAKIETEFTLDLYIKRYAELFHELLESPLGGLGD